MEKKIMEHSNQDSLLVTVATVKRKLTEQNQTPLMSPMLPPTIHQAVKAKKSRNKIDYVTQLDGASPFLRYQEKTSFLTSSMMDHNRCFSRRRSAAVSKQNSGSELFNGGFNPQSSWSHVMLQGSNDLAIDKLKREVFSDLDSRKIGGYFFKRRNINQAFKNSFKGFLIKSMGITYDHRYFELDTETGSMCYANNKSLIDYSQNRISIRNIVSVK